MVRVAIIGAGASGLVAIKTCLEYGFNVVCYEKSQDLGGLWRYRPMASDEPSVMKSTTINTSKEMSAFSDFPPPEGYANFMHNRQFLKYLESYADHFGVVKYIKFNHTVKLVKRAGDYDTTGRWVVTVADLYGNAKTETFDGVMLCSGQFIEPFYPMIPGLRDGTFKGQVLHSRWYKDASGFEDKNVLVLGIGNSGADVAMELSHCAKQVYLSTRRGSWVWNRVFDRGLPWDVFMNSHLWVTIRKFFPGLFQSFIERKLSNRVDLQMYGLKPAHRVFQQAFTFGDEMFNRIISGTIIVKPNTEKATGPKQVQFEDGSRINDIDTVVLCTGYKVGTYTYLEPGVMTIEDDQAHLYKYMYDPTLKHPETIAAICLVHVSGAQFPVSEIQSRVFCEYLQKKRKLPDADTMSEDIHRRCNQMKSAYVSTRRHTVQTRYVQYMHEMAAMIDANPRSVFTYLCQGDPKLAWALMFGPCLPYEFRLNGPHAWNGARDAIMTSWDRMVKAHQTRKFPADAKRVSINGGKKVVFEANLDDLKRRRSSCCGAPRAHLCTVLSILSIIVLFMACLFDVL